jgi:hypothetical protein
MSFAGQTCTMTCARNSRAIPKPPATPPDVPSSPSTRVPNPSFHSLSPPRDVFRPAVELWRLPHEFPIHIDLRAGWFGHDHHGSGPAIGCHVAASCNFSRASRASIHEPSSPSRVYRPHAPGSRCARFFCCRHRFQLQFKMIRAQHKIFSMLLAGDSHPIQRPIGQSDLLQCVPILRNPQYHGVFQSRAKHRMRLVKIAARIIRMKRSRPHHHSIDFHRRARRRTRNLKCFRARRRRGKRQRR